MKGDVLSLATAVIGGAWENYKLFEDVIMPIVGLLTGGVHSKIHCTGWWSL
jgi:large-conductance mechanosensitive channel